MALFGSIYSTIEGERRLSFFVKRKGEELTIFPSKKCSRTITAFTLAGSSNIKNAKHLKQPAASHIIVHASTFPNWEKYSWSAST